jgi:hypothetical protein
MKVFGALALVVACIWMASASPAAAADDCGEIKGWHALATLAEACRTAGFPLEQDVKIKGRFKSFSNYADHLPDWKRGRAEGKEWGMHLFNAGVQADSAAYSCAQGSEMAGRWLDSAVFAECNAK